MSTVTTRLRVMAGPSRAWSQPWFHTAAPKATTTIAVVATPTSTASTSGRQTGRYRPKPTSWVAATAAIAATHQAGVVVARSTAADHTWPASAATATVPAATAASRRGERTSGPGARRPPPATRSWTQASAPSTTSVRSTTDVAPPSSQPRSFHSTATGCSGLPSLMYGNGGESAWMTANATGSRKMAASTTSSSYMPTRPATRRAGWRPATAAGGAPWIGPPITSSAGMLTTPSSGRAVAVAGAPGSAGIVDPPLEDGELQRGDDQRHEEQA